MPTRPPEICKTFRFPIQGAYVAETLDCIHPCLGILWRFLHEHLKSITHQILFIVYFIASLAEVSGSNGGVYGRKLIGFIIYDANLRVIFHLVLEIAVHQFTDNQQRVFTLVEHAIDLLAYGHLHVHFPGK